MGPGLELPFSCPLLPTECSGPAPLLETTSPNYLPTCVPAPSGSPLRGRAQSFFT